MLLGRLIPCTRSSLSLQDVLFRSELRVFQMVTLGHTNFVCPAFGFQDSPLLNIDAWAGPILEGPTLRRDCRFSFQTENFKCSLVFSLLLSNFRVH